MTALSSLLASHLWQSTLCAAVAGLLTLTLKANAARVRYAVWLAASAKFFVPFAALMAIGNQFGWRTAGPPLEANVTVFINRLGPIAPHDLRLFTGTVGVPAPVAPAAATLLDSTALARAGALPWLYAVWLCGAVAVLLVWTIRWRRVAAIASKGSPITGGRELTLLRRLEAACGIRRPIAMVATDSAVEPGVFGILRPVLLWPRTIAEHLSDRQIEAILAHEVSHVRRRDNLAAAMHTVVQAAFWFHPLVWWLGARLVDERERACDEDVIRAGAEPQVYAEGILRTCEFYVESPMVCVTGVTGSDLKKRIEQIMRGHNAVRLGVAKRLLLSITAGVAIVAPVVVGAATAPPRGTRPERRLIESRRYVFAGSPELFERRVEAPLVLGPSEAPTVAQGVSQQPTAPPALSGTVRGPKGGPVPNATLVLTSVDTNSDVTTRSDARGHFELSRLPVGEYLLGVTANGLEPFHGRVTVPAARGVTLDLSLEAQTIAIGMTIGNGFPGPRQGPAAPMPPTWSCIDRPMGRDCGPPSLLRELELDRVAQQALRDALPTRPAWPITSAPPHYPQELWDAMIEGSVVIEGRIGEDGVPTALEVVAPVHPDFAKAALATVSQWRFEPAKQDGDPLSVPLKVTINFRLSGPRVNSTSGPRLPGGQ